MAAAGFDAGDPRLARVLSNYGVACKFAGRYDDGSRAYTQALPVLDAAPVTGLELHGLDWLQADCCGTAPPRDETDAICMTKLEEQH